MAKLTEQRVKATAPAGEKTVRIKLPLTKSERDDVFVGLNGRTFLIKRGVEVDVPEGVAEILRNREEVLAQIIEFEDSANRLGEMK